MSHVENSPEGHATGTVAGSNDHAVAAGLTSSSQPPDAAVRPARKSSRRWVILGPLVSVALVAGVYYLAPIVVRAFQTTSTDDAYVNGHVTFVAPRVQGQVALVLVDDNMRVLKGDLLVELDREPYQVQVDIKKAAVVNAEADVKAAEAQVRATLGLVRSQRWKLQTAMEQVDNDVALLRARVASLRSRQATLDRALADLSRAQLLFDRRAIAREEFDQRREAARRSMGWSPGGTSTPATM
jgi:membrane fusion protein, multidrug efflux system